MTWKRCDGCTRAIAASAFTCEYCGQLCDDAGDLLPIDDDQAGTPPPAAMDSLFGDDAPDVAGTPFETFDELTALPGTVEGRPEPETIFPTEAESANPWRDNRWSEPANAQHFDSDEPAPVAPGLFDAVQEADAARPDETSHNFRLDFVEIAPRASENWAPPAQNDEASSVRVDTPAVTPPIDDAGKKAGPAKPGMGTRQLAMVGGGVLAAGALIFTILGMRGAASPELAAAPAPARRTPANAPARPKPAAPAVVVKTETPAADAPRWSRVTDGRWIGNSHQTAAFELPATGRVHVWTRDVTPVLVVRCEKGNTEAFVYTQSAARMEPQDGDHTVQVAFDDGSPVSERWPDSAEHDALFARQPAEFTRQLTQSRTLHFGFTPHNAQPVVATFVLDGLEPLLAASSKPCGWKP